MCGGLQLCVFHVWYLAPYELISHDVWGRVVIHRIKVKVSVVYHEAFVCLFVSVSQENGDRSPMAVAEDDVVYLHAVS